MSKVPIWNLEHKITNCDLKKAALRKANLQFAELLNDPVRCAPYLKFINDEFDRYSQHRHGKKIPAPDPALYTFQNIQQTYYPVPHTDYRAEKKHCSLQEFLLLLFRQHELGDQVLKWIGFVPEAAANDMVATGSYVTESSFGLTLLHGKLAHMLQTAIMIYAIQSGEISLTYQGENSCEQLGILELLASQVKPGLSFVPNTTIWTQLRDLHDGKRICFCDPHRLTATLMYYGHQFGMSALGNYLIDSFCKSFIKFYRACLEQIPDLGSMDDFADKLRDYIPNELHTPAFLEKYAIKYYFAKPGVFPVSSASNVVGRTLNPSFEFVPRSFGDAVNNGIFGILANK